MRISRTAVLLCLCALIPLSLAAQQSSGPQNSQTTLILQQALAALTGGAPVTDVTMTGTVTDTVAPARADQPPSTDSGTITFVATAAGQGESVVSTSSENRTEIRDISSGSPVLKEKGADGIAHTVTTQSAASPHPAWFYPAMLLESGLSSTSYASSYVGQETWNGVSAQHVSLWLLPSASSTSPQFAREFTQQEIYLDPSSLLPLGVTFTIHPYDPANPNRPIMPYRDETLDGIEQASFSDYRQVQGRPVAFHIHSAMNAGATRIVTDIQFSSISFNTGATIAAN